MLANVDDWKISKEKNSRKLRDAAHVIPHQASESGIDSDSDPEDRVPLAKVFKRHRQERETSSDEEDIPLMELQKRLRHRELRQNQNQETEVQDMECNDELFSDDSCSLPSVVNNDSASEMEVNVVHSHRRLSDKTLVGTVRPQKKRQKKSHDKERGLKQLVRLMSNML